MTCPGYTGHRQSCMMKHQAEIVTRKAFRMEARPMSPGAEMCKPDRPRTVLLLHFHQLSTHF